jgi:hypothetical protein
VHEILSPAAQEKVALHESVLPSFVQAPDAAPAPIDPVHVTPLPAPPFADAVAANTPRAENATTIRTAIRFLTSCPFLVDRPH